MANTYQPGDVVFVGRTPGFTKRIGDVVASERDDTRAEIVTIKARGTGRESRWYAHDLRPAALRHWRRAA